MSEDNPSASLLLQALSQLSQLSQQLGVIQGQNLLILADQRDATESRRVMHEKIDVLHRDHAALNERVGGIEEKVDNLTPLVQSHEAAHQQKVGQLRLVGYASKIAGKGKALIYAVIAGAGAIVTWLVRFGGAAPKP